MRMQKVQKKSTISFEDRCEIIKSIKYVDKVIEKSPLTVDIDFIKNIKLI